MNKQITKAIVISVAVAALIAYKYREHRVSAQSLSNSTNPSCISSTTSSTGSYPLFACVADDDATGTKEIIVGLQNTTSAAGQPGTFKLFIIKNDGTLAAVAGVSPSSVTFGAQLVSTTSAAQVATLSNNGSVTLNISSVAVTGINSSDFTAASSCGTSLAAGASCTISLTFNPGATGVRNASLIITDNAAGSPQTIPLSGTGVDFAITGPSTAVTVSAGQTATFTISLITTGGPTTNATSFTAAGNPMATTVTFNPSSISAGSTTGNTTMMITTTARAAGSTTPVIGPTTLLQLFPMVLATLGLITVALLARRARRSVIVVLGSGLVLAVALILGCGGGGTSSRPPPQQGTPAGTYAITTTATSGSVSRNTTVTLTVN